MVLIFILCSLPLSLSSLLDYRLPGGLLFNIYTESKLQKGPVVGHWPPPQANRLGSCVVNITNVQFFGAGKQRQVSCTESELAPTPSLEVRCIAMVGRRATNSLSRQLFIPLPEMNV